ncbi:MAG TPA: putative oxidoreductase C-terminal domain-containing protein, partial [Bacteroidales bacterium]|nr:putative oxidoreductase C-terminal domain-containing protein [Bacteroidales bacterium]
TRVNGYNQRAENPTRWNEVVYTGTDYLEKMIGEKKGNVVVIAGNNQKKIDYIKASVDAGLNVLSDKPMAINTAAFEQLKVSFEIAKEKGVLLYDIMTERSEISTLLQKEFSMLPAVFGTLQKGTTENPAVTKESVHHFYKFVSGAALTRPAWFFDVNQQGEGIVDVTTHLVDLVQWECFPDQVLDYTKDIKVDDAKRWPTVITPAQFTEVTKLKTYPDYLKEAVKDSSLNIFANGEINYTVKGVHAKVSVIWNYKAPEGGGDTHYSIMRGTKANLIIRQGQEQGFKPTLYIEPVAGTDTAVFATTLAAELKKIQAKYEGVELKKLATSWEVIIPEKYKVGHEAHFAQVTERYLQYLVDGKLPEWEVPNMIAKYYTTTKALEIAKSKK